MSSVKEGKRKTMCAVKRQKVKTRSLELENVEIEMFLEVGKGRKTLEVNWTLEGKLGFCSQLHSIRAVRG